MVRGGGADRSVQSASRFPRADFLLRGCEAHEAMPERIPHEWETPPPGITAEEPVEEARSWVVQVPLDAALHGGGLGGRCPGVRLAPGRCCRPWGAGFSQVTEDGRGHRRQGQGPHRDALLARRHGPPQCPCGLEAEGGAEEGLPLVLRPGSAPVEVLQGAGGGGRAPANLLALPEEILLRIAPPPPVLISTPHTFYRGVLSFGAACSTLHRIVARGGPVWYDAAVRAHAQLCPSVGMGGKSKQYGRKGGLRFAGPASLGGPNTRPLAHPRPLLHNAAPCGLAEQYPVGGGGWRGHTPKLEAP